MTVHVPHSDEAFETPPMMPPNAPLDMPEQNFLRLPAGRVAPRRRPALRTRVARLVTFGGALTLTAPSGVKR